MKSSGCGHAGLQTNGQVTVNLTGTASSTFHCEDSNTYFSNRQAIGTGILLGFDMNSASSVTVAGTTPPDINAAKTGNPLIITW